MFISSFVTYVGQAILYNIFKCLSNKDISYFKGFSAYSRQEKTHWLLDERLKINFNIYIFVKKIKGKFRSNEINTSLENFRTQRNFKTISYKVNLNRVVYKHHLCINKFIFILVILFQKPLRVTPLLCRSSTQSLERLYYAREILYSGERYTITENYVTDFFFAMGQLYCLLFRVIKVI